MKIAFIHYHLKPGGVTTVLRQQVEAILDDCEALVLTGSTPESSFPCDIVNIPGLGYDRPKQNKISPEEVAASIIKAINKILECRSLKTKKCIITLKGIEEMLISNISTEKMKDGGGFVIS